MADGKRVAWSTRRTEVAELVRRHQVEGLSFRELAAQSGIKLPTLYSWIQRLRRESSIGGSEEDAAAGFVEVTARQGAPIVPQSGIELVLTSGVRMHLAPSFDAGTLKRLLLLLSA